MKNLFYLLVFLSTIFTMQSCKCVGTIYDMMVDLSFVDENGNDLLDTVNNPNAYDLDSIKLFYWHSVDKYFYEGSKSLYSIRQGSEGVYWLDFAANDWFTFKDKNGTIRPEMYDSNVEESTILLQLSPDDVDTIYITFWHDEECDNVHSTDKIFYNGRLLETLKDFTIVKNKH